MFVCESAIQQSLIQDYNLETPGLGATPSSGSGPRVDPPLAEDVPDMADTESPLLLLDRISDCWS